MRTNLREWLIIILSFILVLYMYAIFSYFGVEDFIQEGVLKEYFDTNIWHLEVIFSGILLGILFILVNQLTEKQIFRRKSFGFNILLKSALYLIGLIIVCLLIFELFLFFELVPQEQMEKFQALLSAKFYISGVLYYASFILILNFILYINQKLGPGLLIDLLTGKYYHPRNEELIFLFVDLKNSTSLAEKLGHIEYSKFIKECVHELTPVIQKFNARVYQYAGDEVILFWSKKEGFRELNCLNAFFEFSDILNRQKEYFKSKYGEIPIFKAGMDVGIVTATEIGDIKREIAYHGDVLNTAARLEKKCNEFNEKLIITQNVIDQIQSANGYNFKLLSDLPLRGKTENIKFYSVKS
ncbi:adenylate/guanylate cyclase domain-containing protein [Labilibaculum antarcticum]|uniref:Adenylate cyclase n=1 Tax=Labilibaculum antarcticum TaxID=1717717 RepID=A0A1Y1CET6_9BACT|nr:adenylate/guanylate cyclase domain-containing protein [Labilibaculum antarcticum]BAX78868.1 adenylate cyclase [Labilibaculum antarcticum]